jgi:S-phase kinase-associated protein 1
MDNKMDNTKNISDITITRVNTDLFDESLVIPPIPISLDDGINEDKIEKKIENEVKDDNPTGLDDDTNGRIYTVVSKDNKKFKMNENSFYMSGLLKTLSECEDKEDLLLSNVTSEILSKVILYLEHHAKEPVPQDNSPEKLKSNIFSENIKCQWDVKYIENDIMSNPITAKEILYEIIRAANYMDIQTLLQLSCTKVACMIKGESLEAIGQIIAPEIPYVDNHKEV